MGPGCPEGLRLHAPPRAPPTQATWGECFEVRLSLWHSPKGRQHGSLPHTEKGTDTGPPALFHQVKHSR